MTKFIDYRLESKKSYGTNKEDHESENLTSDQLQLGSLLRIADSVESMSRNYVQMQKEIDLYKKWYKEEQESNNKLRRSNASLRGHLKKTKNELNELSSLKFLI